MTIAVDRMTQSDLPRLAHAEAICRQAGARLTRLRRQLGFEVGAEALEVTGSGSTCRGEAAR
jgi:hypothetical protein